MMYTGLKGLTLVFLFSKINFGNAGNLPSCVYDACDRITDPEYITTSCCPAMDRLIEVIRECKGDSPTISTCRQATCVVGRYGILTDGQVDFRKAEQAIVELDEINSDQIPLTDLGRKYCIRGGNYTCFPSEDPYCDNWKFMNCAFFAARMACPITYSDCACDDIADDVVTCRPYQKKYVRELNKGCSNRCSVPPAPLPRRRPPTTEFVEIYD